MISRLVGSCIGVSENGAIIDVSGVGFFVALGTHTIGSIKEGDTLTLFTHLVVREDRFELYGFLRESEKNFFMQLIKVRDVGPKTALAILSLGNLAEVQQAIMHGDVATLTSVSGVGKKTAERIILELKEKVFAEGVEGKPMQGTNSIAAALQNLGYSHKEAQEAVRGIPKEMTSDDERLRWVLQSLGKSQRS